MTPQLNVDDFPIHAIGQLVYARTRSTAVCIANTDAMATEIAAAMNKTGPATVGARWKSPHFPKGQRS